MPAELQTVRYHSWHHMRSSREVCEYLRAHRIALYHGDAVEVMAGLRRRFPNACDTYRGHVHNAFAGAGIAGNAAAIRALHLTPWNVADYAVGAFVREGDLRLLTAWFATRERYLRYDIQLVIHDAHAAPSPRRVLEFVGRLDPTMFSGPARLDVVISLLRPGATETLKWLHSVTPFAVRSFVPNVVMTCALQSGDGVLVRWLSEVGFGITAGFWTDGDEEGFTHSIHLTHVALDWAHERAPLSRPVADLLASNAVEVGGESFLEWLRLNGFRVRYKSLLADFLRNCYNNARLIGARTGDHDRRLLGWFWLRRPDLVRRRWRRITQLAVEAGDLRLLVWCRRVGLPSLPDRAVASIVGRRLRHLRSSRIALGAAKMLGIAPS